MKNNNLQNELFQHFKSAVGPNIYHLLQNEDGTIEEIMRNPNGTVWVDKKGIGEEITGFVQSNIDALRTIQLVATANKKICNEKNQILSGVIPGLRYRFQGMHPDVVESPVWAIRIPSRDIYTIDNYEAAEIITKAESEALKRAVLKGRNITVVGGTKSGKTTFVNALLAESAKVKERHVLIEDTVELRCKAENCVPLLSNEYSSSAELLVATLRLSPKRIIIGEARIGAVAETMLMAANTGHEGIICTIHASSAIDGIYRIEEMLAEAGKNPVPRSIARALDIIVYIEAQKTGGRKVKEIVKVKGFKNNEYIVTPLLEEAV